MSKKFKVGDRVVIKDLGVNGVIRYIEDYCIWGIPYAVELDEKCERAHPITVYGLDLKNALWIAESNLEPITERIVINRKGNHVIAHNTATGKKGIAKCNPKDTFDFNIGAKLAFERLMSTKRIVKQDKYEVGDKVKIVDKWTNKCFQNSSGLMDKYLGTVMTIRKITSFCYRMEEDKHENINGWAWGDECIEGKVVEDYEAAEPKKEEPKKLYNGKVVCINYGSIPEHLTVGKIYEFVNGMSRNNVGGYITSTPVKDVDELNTRLMPSKFIEVIE